MKLESNKRGIRALLTLVVTVIVIFLIENKFLVSELRGETISQYTKIKWIDKILLLVDDFEGLKGDSLSLQNAGFFTYGNAKASLDSSEIDDNNIASKTCLKVEWKGNDLYGGWGKGVGKNFDLNTLTDYLNFRIYVPKNNGSEANLKIFLEEDDDHDGKLKSDKDDSWFYTLTVMCNDKWQFISIPLKSFVDGNAGGDSLLNITRKGGLHTVLFAFEQTEKITPNQKWYFDFICFTNEKITDSTVN